MPELQNFGRLAEQLIRAGDRPGDDALRSVAAMLAAPGLFPAVVRHCADLRPEEMEDLLALSTERSTHYKWCLASTGHRGAKIWLHSYKHWPEGERGFAASIHDHRYSFTSAVLQGGLVERRWLPDGPDKIREGPLNHYGSGSVYSIHSSEIHSIERAAPGTITLVVQSATDRTASRVFHRRKREFERSVPDLETLFADMVDGWNS